LPGGNTLQYAQISLLQNAGKPAGQVHRALLIIYLISNSITEITESKNNKKFINIAKYA